VIERLAIVILLAVAGVGVFAIGARWQVRRVARTQAADPVLARLRPGIPAVIYFWSEICGPCQTAQKPALKQLQAALGKQGVQIVAVNALEEPDIADGWGVLGLPTTFIVDPSGQVRGVNHGVVRVEKLLQQIAAVSTGHPSQS
jgi:thiol-disulfide isomerase/thioredoxin